MKDRKRLYAIDSLLISATLLIVATLGLTLGATKIKTPATSHAKQTKAIKECDDAVDNLSEAGYADELPEPYHRIIVAISGNAVKELKDAEEKVQKQANDYPDTSAINARLAIILHAEGKETAPLFAQLKSAMQADHQDSIKYQFRIQSFLVVDAIFFLLGFVSIGCCFKFKESDQIPVIPMTTEFRRMYGCLISTLFAEVISGGAIGFWIGISHVLWHTSSDYSSFSTLMGATLVISSTVFSLLLVYLLILKPQALSLQGAFTRSSMKLNRAKIVMFALGGFCASNTLNIIGRVLYHLVPNAGRPTNPNHLEMVNAFVTGNIPMICWSVFLACVMAPCTEELLFRGLLFGWLRYKFGSLPAILISSVIFAAWHFDLNGFVQYFLLGIVLSTVYNRTRNLWISIMIHGLWNFWVVSTVFWATSYHG